MTSTSLKCLFAAATWRGMTAMEFVIAMMHARENDQIFYRRYSRRVGAALSELGGDVAYGEGRGGRVTLSAVALGERGNAGELDRVAVTSFEPKDMDR
ncbi:MAG: hypothetical protein H0U59_04130 [Gemmatimonadaceae bacterium]|nr:hypothetical protein [Gemmatimonadaceae bacterium]